MLQLFNSTLCVNFDDSGFSIIAGSKPPIIFNSNTKMRDKFQYFSPSVCVSMSSEVTIEVFEFL